MNMIPGCLCRDCENWEIEDGDFQGYCSEYDNWLDPDHGCTAGVRREPLPPRFVVEAEIPPYENEQCSHRCPIFTSCEWARWVEVEGDSDEIYPGPGCPRYISPEEKGDKI